MNRKARELNLDQHYLYEESESFNNWGARRCRKCVPVLGEDGTKTAPPGDIFDQPPGGLILIRGKLADHVNDHAVLSPERAVLVTTPET